MQFSRIGVFALLFPCACSVDPAPLRLANPDQAAFAETVYPLLLRDCGFPACHGEEDRFFRIYGPGRTRLGDAADAGPGDPETEAELMQSYRRARSMIDTQQPQRSLLLRKPLSVRAGGSGHKGLDAWSRNVYASVQDPGYQLLRQWVFSQGAAPADAGVTQ